MNETQYRPELITLPGELEEIYQRKREKAHILFNSLPGRGQALDEAHLVQEAIKNKLCRQSSKVR